MALFNHTTRDLTAKIVYYGPGLCGKTTNLKVLHGELERASKGRLLSLATAQDRTIYFDLLPVELGNIKGYTVRFQLCTVPGQVFYNETRKIVLRGADGVVFVVDSQGPMLSHNLESFQNLRENLRDEKISLEAVPIVIQYNKRDLPSALPVAAMQESLGFAAYPFVEAVAADGRGVVETFRLISKLTFVDLLRRLQKGGPVTNETAAAALAAATEAVPLAPAGPAESVFGPPEPERSPEPASGPPAEWAPVVPETAPAPVAAAAVFEESALEEELWNTPGEDDFPDLDDEPSLARPAVPEATQLDESPATTRAIRVPALATLVAPEPALAPETTSPVTPAATTAPEEPPEEETLGARPGPDEAEVRRLEDSLTRALHSMSEESARREQVEGRLNGRIAALEEELATLRRELQEARDREESLKSLTEGLSRRWDSLRRLLAQDEPPAS